MIPIACRTAAMPAVPVGVGPVAHHRGRDPCLTELEPARRTGRSGRREWRSIHPGDDRVRRINPNGGVHARQVTDHCNSVPRHAHVRAEAGRPGTVDHGRAHDDQVHAHRAATGSWYSCSAVSRNTRRRSPGPVLRRDTCRGPAPGRARASDPNSTRSGPASSTTCRTSSNPAKLLAALEVHVGGRAATAATSGLGARAGVRRDDRAGWRSARRCRAPAKSGPSTWILTGRPWPASALEQLGHGRRAGRLRAVLAVDLDPYDPGRIAPPAELVVSRGGRSGPRRDSPEAVPRGRMATIAALPVSAWKRSFGSTKRSRARCRARRADRPKPPHRAPARPSGAGPRCVDVEWHPCPDRRPRLSSGAAGRTGAARRPGGPASRIRDGRGQTALIGDVGGRAGTPVLSSTRSCRSGSPRPRSPEVARPLVSRWRCSFLAGRGQVVDDAVVVGADQDHGDPEPRGPLADGGRVAPCRIGTSSGRPVRPIARRRASSAAEGVPGEPDHAADSSQKPTAPSRTAGDSGRRVARTQRCHHRDASTCGVSLRRLCPAPVGGTGSAWMASRWRRAPSRCRPRPARERADRCRPRPRGSAR